MRRRYPTQNPPAAVWWRIAPHTSPAVLTPTHGPALPTPRPVWLQQMAATLTPRRRAPAAPGPPLARRGHSAVSHRAIDHGIPAADVLRQPVGLDGDPAPNHSPPDALIYRAATLTDPTQRARPLRPRPQQAAGTNVQPNTRRPPR